MGCAALLIQRQTMATPLLATLPSLQLLFSFFVSNISNLLEITQTALLFLFTLLFCLFWWCGQLKHSPIEFALSLSLFQKQQHKVIY